MSGNWDFLIGYPLEEAEEILAEENIAYQIQHIVAPRKAISTEGIRVIAVREGNPLQIISTGADWSIK